MPQANQIHSFTLISEIEAYDVAKNNVGIGAQALAIRSSAYYSLEQSSATVDHATVLSVTGLGGVRWILVPALATGLIAKGQTGTIPSNGSVTVYTGPFDASTAYSVMGSCIVAAHGVEQRMLIGFADTFYQVNITPSLGINFDPDSQSLDVVAVAFSGYDTIINWALFAYKVL